RRRSAHVDRIRGDRGRRRPFDHAGGRSVRARAWNVRLGGRDSARPDGRGRRVCDRDVACTGALAAEGGSCPLMNSPTGLPGAWLKANLVATLVFVCAGVAVFGLKLWVGGGLGLNAKTMLALFVAVAIYGTAGGYGGVVTGRVLGEILPAFPHRGWI